MDVWTDDVLRDVLRESRRRRRVRRRARVALVAVAGAFGAAAGLAAALLLHGQAPAPLASVSAPPPSEVPLPATVVLLSAVAPGPPIAAGAQFLDAFLLSLPVAAPAPPDALAAVESPEPAAVAPLVEGVLEPGDTLIASLARHGVANATVALIARELRAHFDFRRAKPGHRYRVERDAQGALVSFRYHVSEHEHYEVTAKGGSFETKSAQRSLLRQQARLAGVVSTSLYDAFQDLGERPQLAADFAAIFAWEFDFAKGVRSGDEFHVLYERSYAPRSGGGELRYVGPGRILAARYKNGGRTLEAVYYEAAPGRGGYYRPSGESVRQTFLAAPLRYSRITSSFTPARFHPILRVTRAHPGIDYAAPAGTPVWAVASGRVTHVGWMGGFGRLVKVEHADGYESYYAHLSSFARGLRVGSTVSQKQVIGYVGSSGLSTGPHVCFRIAKNGRFVNPISERIPSGDRIPPRQRQDFETVRDARLAQLVPAPLVATGEAM